MAYCTLHEIEYSNVDDECPLCARDETDATSRPRKHRISGVEKPDSNDD